MLSEAIDLEKVEFIATSDPCYSKFEIYKSSDVFNEIPPSIVLVQNDELLTTGVIVEFAKNETCILPLTSTYKLYGTLTDTSERILLSHGVLYTVPCKCCDECNHTYWDDIEW